MPEPCIHLLIQYCNDPRPPRAAEYDECVRRNLANPHIVAVHNLVETKTIVPDEFKQHPKYVEHPAGGWLTYREAFEYANANLAGRTVALVNLDIFLDPAGDWHTAQLTVTNSPIVLCLSRMEFNADGTTFKDPGLDGFAFANSQDAWIFGAPMEIPDCDFELGTLGCDNAIAHRIKHAGKVPINAPDRFKIFHFDRVRGKDHMNQWAVHAQDRPERPRGKQPVGQYLLPNIDTVKSVDAILSALKATEVQKYILICDLLSQGIKLDNY